MNINIDLLQKKYRVEITADIAESLSRKYGLTSTVGTPFKNLQPAESSRVEKTDSGRKAGIPDNSVKVRPAEKKSDIRSSVERKKIAGAVEVDEKYIRNMQQAFKAIAGLLFDYDRKCMEGLMTGIIDNDDYDDAEEIMGKINSAIQQYMYDTSKISLGDLPKIEQFVISIGYRPVSVKAGDSIKDNIRYFKAIEIKNSMPQFSKKIKAIENKPYKIKYIDGNETAELILQGSCTYYR